MWEFIAAQPDIVAGIVGAIVTFLASIAAIFRVIVKNMQVRAEERLKAEIAESEVRHKAALAEIEVRQSEAFSDQAQTRALMDNMLSSQAIIQQLVDMQKGGMAAIEKMQTAFIRESAAWREAVMAATGATHDLQNNTIKMHSQTETVLQHTVVKQDELHGDVRTLVVEINALIRHIKASEYIKALNDERRRRTDELQTINERDVTGGVVGAGSAGAGSGGQRGGGGDDADGGRGGDDRAGVGGDGDGDRGGSNGLGEEPGPDV